MRLGTADVLVRAKTDQYKKDLKTAETRTEQFGKRAAASVGSVTSSFASLAGVAGIGGLAIATIKAGAQFESQMASVQAVMRASAADYDLLAAAAKKMGEETEWSATQSAEALNYMGLAGWGVQKSIEGLPGMLDAATAAGIGLGETSDILTDTLTAMGLGIEDIGRLTDVMTGTTTRANTDFRQMGEAMKEAAPYAKAYGFEIEEVAALMGIIADAGIRASDAGTGLKNTWINNAKAAKILGTGATDLIGTLRAANEAQWDTNKFAEVYGKIAGKTVLNIAAQIDKYEALTKTLHDVKGETKKIAKIKLDTLYGDFKILKSTIEGVGLAAYENIEGELRGGIKDLTDFIRDNKQEFVDFAKGAKDTAVSLGAIGIHAASLFKTTIDGWNSLPMIVQEMGIVGALIGGKKAAAALLLITSAIGKAKELNDLAKTITPAEKMAGQLKIAENRLIKLKERYADLRGVDIETFGPKYQRDIEAAEKRVKELSRSIKSELTDINYKDFWLLKARDMPKIMDGIKPKPKDIKEVVDGTDEIAEAYIELYSRHGIATQEAYDALSEQYTADRDRFISVIGDKQAASEAYNARLLELEEDFAKRGIETRFAPVRASLDEFFGDIEKEETEVGVRLALDDFFGDIEKEETEVGVRLALDDFFGDIEAAEKEVGNFATRENDTINDSDLGKSIIRMMANMAIQAMIVKPLMGMMGITASAQGNVFSGAGIGAYENQIVSKPTIFPFAQGMGLMGEAGSEAIMPLTRMPGGDLGVKTETPGDRRPMVVNIYEGEGTKAEVEQSEDGMSMNVIIEQVEQSIQGRMNRGAGMAPFLDGRYGRRM
jgi:TP901 family phage tail tape measure protein